MGQRPLLHQKAGNISKVYQTPRGPKAPGTDQITALGGPPAAPPAGPFNGHIKRAVGVGWSGRVPLHPGRLGWGGGGQNRAKNGLV